MKPFLKDYDPCCIHFKNIRIIYSNFYLGKFIFENKYLPNNLS